MAEDATNVTVAIGHHELMVAIRRLTVNNENFRHEAWAIWDAETFESAARMIREGYGSKGGK